jgi:molybdopterin-guanine dinucleotide biosynthesis protein A
MPPGEEIERAGLTGILLVGGESRRFGSVKALARLGSETLADRAWSLLGEACEHRLAVGKVADALPLSFDVLDDGSDVRAPLVGVVAGLRAAPTELCVVCPVDTPLLTVDAIHRLADACLDAAVPESGPLPGAYRRSALPVLETELERGNLKLRDAVAKLRVVVVALPPEVVANVNSPDELEAIGRRASPEVPGVTPLARGSRP